MAIHGLAIGPGKQISLTFGKIEIGPRVPRKVDLPSDAHWHRGVRLVVDRLASLERVRIGMDAREHQIEPSSHGSRVDLTDDKLPVGRIDEVREFADQGDPAPEA
jgi:hypothetical protein